MDLNEGLAIGLVKQTLWVERKPEDHKLVEIVKDEIELAHCEGTARLTLTGHELNRELVRDVRCIVDSSTGTILNLIIPIKVAAVHSEV